MMSWCASGHDFAFLYLWCEEIGESNAIVPCDDGEVDQRLSKFLEDAHVIEEERRGCWQETAAERREYASAIVH